MALKVWNIEDLCEYLETIRPTVAPTTPIGIQYHDAPIISWAFQIEIVKAEDSEFIIINPSRKYYQE